MIYTMEQFKRKIERWQRDQPEAVEKGMRKGLERMVGTAKLKHLSGPKMPRGVGSKTHGTLQPRSGDLRAAMGKKIKRTGTGVHGYLVNSMVYAAVHEYGYPPMRMPQRSFARPSINDEMEHLKDDITKAVIASYEHA